MCCDGCGKPIGVENEPAAYQVRIGYADAAGDFMPDEDTGYFCSDCLKKGV